MVTIVLECSKRNEWEIKTENGFVICVSRHNNKEDAIKWCENYMTSFHFFYELRIIENKR